MIESNETTSTSAPSANECYPGTAVERPAQVGKGGQGRYCCVPGCGNTSYMPDGKTLTGIGFFSFPKTNHTLMNKWLKVFSSIRRKGGKDNFDPNKDSAVVCEFHFPITDILYTRSLTGNVRKKPKPGVVPSIFSFKPTQGKAKRKAPMDRSRNLVSSESEAESESEFAGGPPPVYRLPV